VVSKTTLQDGKIMKKFKQDGTIVKVGMEVKYSPWLFRPTEKDDKMMMSFGKVVAIKKEKNYARVDNPLEVVFHILLTKVIYATFPSRFTNASYDLRKLGKISSRNPEVWRPVGENEPNFVGFKVGMKTGYVHSNNFVAEIVRQKGMVFTWFVKRQWDSKGKRIDSVIGTIIPCRKKHDFVTRANIRLNIEEIQVIQDFLERLNTRKMFSINEPFQCVFCKKLKYEGYIACHEKKRRSGYTGKGAVCEGCCRKVNCKECYTTRKIISECAKK